MRTAVLIACTLAGGIAGIPVAAALQYSGLGPQGQYGGIVMGAIGGVICSCLIWTYERYQQEGSDRRLRLSLDEFQKPSRMGHCNLPSTDPSC